MLKYYYCTECAQRENNISFIDQYFLLGQIYFWLTVIRLFYHILSSCVSKEHWCIKFGGGKRGGVVYTFHGKLNHPLIYNNLEKITEGLKNQQEELPDSREENVYSQNNVTV